MIEARLAFLISGGTGSGKPTLGLRQGSGSACLLGFGQLLHTVRSRLRTSSRDLNKDAVPTAQGARSWSQATVRALLGLWGNGAIWPSATMLHTTLTEVANAPDKDRRDRLRLALTGLGKPVPSYGFVFDASWFDQAASDEAGSADLDNTTAVRIIRARTVRSLPSARTPPHKEEAMATRAPPAGFEPALPPGSACRQVRRVSTVMGL
jgi:hypothetical protein